jgi:hypothetical protein
MRRPGPEVVNIREALAAAEDVKNEAIIDGCNVATIVVRNDSLFHVWAYKEFGPVWDPKKDLPGSTAEAALFGSIVNIKSALAWAGAHKIRSFCAFDTSRSNVACYRHIQYGETFYNRDIESGARHFWTTPDSARKSGWVVMIPWGSACWIDGNLYSTHMATFGNFVSYPDRELVR